MKTWKQSDLNKKRYTKKYLRNDQKKKTKGVNKHTKPKKRTK